MKRNGIRMAVAAALAATATAVAPTAHADEWSYLHALDDSGYWGSSAAWLTIGYTVCSMVSQGANQDQVTTYVYTHTDAYTGWYSAGRAVELAEIFLC